MRSYVVLFAILRGFEGVNTPAPEAFNAVLCDGGVGKLPGRGVFSTSIATVCTPSDRLNLIVSGFLVPNPCNLVISSPSTKNLPIVSAVPLKPYSPL